MTQLTSIGPAFPEGFEEGLSLVFRDLLAEDRAERVRQLLDGARLRDAPLDGLVEARRGGRLVGGVFSEVQPGRAAVVWPPRLVPGEPASTGERRVVRSSARYTVASARTVRKMIHR